MHGPRRFAGAIFYAGRDSDRIEQILRNARTT